MHVLTQIMLVAVGSACGGLARWGIGAGAGRWFGATFPVGTFLINVAGSLFLGWFLTVLSDRSLSSEAAWLRPDDLRLLIAVGFTGSFTTFSTFSYESHALVRDGDGLAAVTYMVGSVLLGLLAIRLGIMLARAW